MSIMLGCVQVMTRSQSSEDLIIDFSLLSLMLFLDCFLQQ